MRVPITMTVCLSAAFLALTPAADAHTLASAAPQAGDAGTTFVFKGRAWQPRGRIRADYFASQGETQPRRSFPGRVTRKGTFRFTLRNFVIASVGLTEKICFVQFDTRPQLRRTFRSCARFYVAPPHAYFMAPTGRPGDAFFLVANGFPPGQNLTILLTTPTGVVQTYTMTTATRAAFVPGGLTGSVFVPRGGALRTFQSNSGDPLGTYTALIEGPGGASARAAITLEP
jgi:hypothetical protein